MDKSLRSAAVENKEERILENTDEQKSQCSKEWNELELTYLDADAWSRL